MSVRQLQLLTEELASATAIVIDAEPGELPDAAVSRYFGLAVESIEMIDGAAIADDADAARVSARGIAEFARDTVANYLVRTQFEVSRSADEVTEPRDGT